MKPAGAGRRNTLDMSYEQIEKIAIEQALLRRDGDMLKSAKALGMPRKELLEKIKKYGLS